MTPCLCENEECRQPCDCGELYCTQCFCKEKEDDDEDTA